MKHFDWLSLRMVPTWLLVVVCGCSDGGSDGDLDGFDEAAHEAVCAKFVEAGCTDTTLETCLTASENTYERHSACREAFNVWAACAGSRGDVTCGDVGFIVWNCEAEQSAWSDCVDANGS